MEEGGGEGCWEGGVRIREVEGGGGRRREVGGRREGGGEGCWEGGVKVLYRKGGRGECGREEHY